VPDGRDLGFIRPRSCQESRTRGSKPSSFLSVRHVDAAECPTSGCTRTAAPRFSFDAPGNLDVGFAANARSRRRSVIRIVR
jgi:hypothetical protein